MNSVNIIGRITKDLELKGDSTKFVRFSVAINRGKDKDGNDRGADFPNVIFFGKTAETLCKYFNKGRMIAVSGHIQTSSYEKDGNKYYSTDIIGDRFFFCDSVKNESAADDDSEVPEGFVKMTDDDIPF